MIDHELKPLEIVVVNTRAGFRYGQPDYSSSGVGMVRDAPLYLLYRISLLRCHPFKPYMQVFIYDFVSSRKRL